MISVLKTIIVCATVVVCLYILTHDGNGGKQ